MNGITYYYMGNKEDGDWCFKDVTDNARKHFSYEEYAKKWISYFHSMKPV